jgi:uncharacterized metal-binding protein YceD (DUF177 family)
LRTGSFEKNNLSEKLMKIRLADLWDGPQELHGELAPEPYDLILNGDDKWLPIKYRFTAELLGEELLVRGSINTSVQTPCARCLEPITLKVSLPEFACAIPFTTEESIDLTLSIREDILLSLPMAPCHADVGGKCPPHVEKIYAADVDKFAEQRRSETWGALEKFKEERE